MKQKKGSVCSVVRVNNLILIEAPSWDFQA